MSESITVRGGEVVNDQDAQQIIALLNQVLADLTNIRNTFNSHTHGGPTPTPTLPALNLLA